MRVIVVGGGIGGLAAALSLGRAGIAVTVLEAVREPSPLGVGINLQPHAVRELSELGLGAALAARAIETAEVRHTDRFGTTIWAQARGRGLGYRWPQYSVHRGELQMLMLEEVRARLGSDAVRTGARCEGVTEHADDVELTVRDRATGQVDTLRADVVVGADGLHSTLRELMHPGQAPLRHAGIRMWRGICETERFLSGSTMVVVGSNAATRMVAYPISRPADDRGRSLVNWVVEVPADTEAGPAPDWNRAGPASEVLAHVEGWGPDWLDAAGLVRGSDEVLTYPMVDREPLPRWGWDRVTLLGDAAHAMLPVGSNGGSQAIVDARVLAHALALSGDPVAGLRRYREERQAITRELVLATRTNPADVYLRLVEERAPHGFERIEDVLTRAELDAIAATYDRITNSDVDELNTRPSLTPGPGHATA